VQARQFATFLACVVVAALLALAPAVLANRAADRPHDFTMLLNGKKAPLEDRFGPDNYTEMRDGKKVLVATWKTDAAGTGTFVRISTTESRHQVYASCFRGTTCRVAVKIPVVPKQEMSFALELVTTKDHKVIEGYKVCLVGR